MNQCPPSPWVFHKDHFNFFRKIRLDNGEWMFISGVNDTGDKMFSGVNDTAGKFIGGVVDTGD